MDHPKGLLPDYALGMLAPQEAAELEAHLATCLECRAELRDLEAIIGAVAAAPSTVETVMDELAPVPPPKAAWRRIREAVRPSPVRPKWLTLAAAVALAFGMVGLWWGLSQQQRYRELLAEEQDSTRQVQGLQAERRLLEEYLFQPEVQVLLLRNPDSQVIGTLLFLPRETQEILFVLQDLPPEGSRYQVWGHKGEDIYVPLASSRQAVFASPWEGYMTIVVSLEPDGGSQRPTQILATIPLG